MRRSKLVFHPLTVSIFAALAVICYTAWMRWRFPGGDLSNHFFYVLPIIFPFVTFLFNRAERIQQASLLELSIDALVVGVSILRMMGGVPLVSGHALFLAYAIARPGTRLTQVTAALVMLQVIYLKFMVWHDPISPVTGITLGLLAALFVRWIGPRVNPEPATANVSNIQ